MCLLEFEVHELNILVLKTKSFPQLKEETISGLLATVVRQVP